MRQELTAKENLFTEGFFTGSDIAAFVRAKGKARVTPHRLDRRPAESLVPCLWLRNLSRNAMYCK